MMVFVCHRTENRLEKEDCSPVFSTFLTNSNQSVESAGLTLDKGANALN